MHATVTIFEAASADTSRTLQASRLCASGSTVWHTALRRQRLLYGGNTSVPFTLCSDAEAAAFVNPNPNQPFVLLIDRGGTDCTFVSKVRRAQKIGAAGALIVDDRCLCADAACVSVEACEAVEPIMADDGSGADITIPSFLMKKPDGDTIKTHLQAQRFIQVSKELVHTASLSQMLARSAAAYTYSTISQQY